MADRTSVEDLALLVEQTSRLVHALGHREGLFPAQWAALRHFGQAPPEAATVVSFANLQHLRRSAAARTVRVLMEKGLLRPRARSVDEPNGVVEITPRGAALLRSDPHGDLMAALADLPPDDRAALRGGLLAVLSRLRATVRAGKPG